jgi:hypothetical protein
MKICHLASGNCLKPIFKYKVTERPDVEGFCAEAVTLIPLFDNQQVFFFLPTKIIFFLSENVSPKK